MNIRIEVYGSHVASVWDDLRPATRNLFERAFISSTTNNAPARISVPPVAPYDCRAEWELSRLLAALDERLAEGASINSLSEEQTRELRRMTETCVVVLETSAQSAEIFAQLIERALHARDYRKVDQLSDAFSAQLAPSEICELARNLNPAIRAIAEDALAQTNISTLVELLTDPVDSPLVRDALERQAFEYGSEEARWIIGALDEEIGGDETGEI